MPVPFDAVLIANRGEIACRIIRTLNRMGIRSVAVFSEADRESLHVAQADEAWCIGPAAASESYLSTEAIIRAAKESGASAIHPGYGFLSENPDFARDCAKAGFVFIGPKAEDMEIFGLKHSSREAALNAGVPLLPGTGLLSSVEEALEKAKTIGWPIMLKSTGGGGGIGMRVCRNSVELTEAWTTTGELAGRNFKNPGLYIERYVEEARHVEVQVFGDGMGGVAILGDRDCSAQRRNQKVIEETPSPGLTGSMREALHESARRLCRSRNYRNAGTVEFVYDRNRDEFSFLEVNTRLQVEHTVTEEVWGIDLVEWMIREAAGLWSIDEALELRARGTAIQARIYAEDPYRNFRPSSGLITQADFDPSARVETWIAPGVEFGGTYDPLVAKIIVHAADRPAAIEKLRIALDRSRIGGICTNRSFLLDVVTRPEFLSGSVTTHFLAGLRYQESAFEVLKAGTQTTVQDVPARMGYWQVGVPPSGPMDGLSLRLANRLLENPEDAAGLECTHEGPHLCFRSQVRICLTGADMGADIDGVPLAPWTVRTVPGGAVIRLGRVRGPGHRAYLAVEGGIDVPRYLGSRSTFTLGGFGGHGGRALREGDVIPFFGPNGDPAQQGAYTAREGVSSSAPITDAAGTEIMHEAFGNREADAWTSPLFSSSAESAWEPARIRVLPGPQGAPEHFKASDLSRFLEAEWEVHFNSSRTGVRLIGPVPDWPRMDGGEAGLHPSNIHDNPYAIGAMDFTGDMPVLLGPDGPSLGGFVCPFTVIHADLWKLGQLSPGMKLRFSITDLQGARRAEAANRNLIASLAVTEPESAELSLSGNPEISLIARQHIVDEWTDPHGTLMVLRFSGDRSLLVEVGEAHLDPGLRFIVQWWLETIEAMAVPGIIDLTPGIRSLQIHFDDDVLTWETLVPLLRDLSMDTPSLEDMTAQSRTVWLPLSWDDPATGLAVEKYMATVRPDAPWCPSNIEFIRRINGLDSVEQVRNIVFEASYLVMGLGDVYLGAPVATPLDPRHRLVTTKYNPARTWTPENAVGIGGAYLCVYGMEGPGGYQFVGRTVQMWNRFRTVSGFEQPWLLRFFDRIRFYPVDAAELLRLRKDFPIGRAAVKIEDGLLSWREYKAFLTSESVSIEAFRDKQRAAFAEERARWKASGLDSFRSDQGFPDGLDETDLSPEDEHVRANVSGSLWKILAAEGRSVRSGETIAILESMKMEIHLPAPMDGTVVGIHKKEGDSVRQGQVLFSISS